MGAGHVEEQTLRLRPTIGNEVLEGRGFILFPPILKTGPGRCRCSINIKSMIKYKQGIYRFYPNTPLMTEGVGIAFIEGNDNI